MSDADDEAFARLAEAWACALREGRAEPPEAVARAHPAHAERILALFPVLALVERAKASRVSGPAPEPPPPPVAPPVGAPEGLPATVGPFRVVRELGRGATGRVLEALGPDGSRAAVKVVHPHLRSDPATVARFLREAEAGRRVRHPGVVRTLDAGRAVVDGLETPWIAMEAVDGRDLRAVLAEAGPVGERFARVVGAAVADALAAVHAAGLVHRDVKPENVVVTAREDVRLADLGLALLRDEATRLSATGAFVGTLLYAAPEQLRGATVGPEADLYALGGLLAELVSGRAPAAAALGDGPRPPLRTLADVSPCFEAVVEGLLAPAPADRLGDAARVATILREGEASAWWRARAPSAPRRAGDGGVPFVGRDTELARLDDAFEGARRGRGRVVVVEGEAGLGKSRLVHTWLERLRARGAAGLRAAVAAAEDGDGTVPSLAPALRALVGEDDLEARLAVRLDEGRRLAPALAASLRGEPAAATVPEPSLHAAYRLLVRGLAREGPLVLVVEDADRAPGPTQRLVAALARAVGAEPVMLVVTAAALGSGELGEALRALAHTEVVVLDPLGRDAAHDLFLAAVGGGPTTAPWHEAVRAAAGNPLFLLEAARAARTSADAAPAPGLRGVVARRLRGLDAPEHHLLAVAACAGDPFDPLVACEAAGERPLAGLQRLHRLDRDHRLLVADGERYRFRHAAVRDAVRAALPPALRRAIHGALAVATATGPGDDALGARAYAVASHHLEGGTPVAAVPFADAALRHATERRAPREVARLARALLDLGEALPPVVEARAVVALGVAYLTFEDPSASVPTLESGLALARSTGDLALVGYAASQLAAALADAARQHDALEVLTVAEDAAVRAGSARDRAAALSGRAATLLDLSRLPEAEAVAHEAVAVAETTDDAWCRATAAYHLGVVRLERGDSVGARAPLEHAAREAEALGDTSLETSARTALGKLAYLSGRLDASRLHLDRLVALARDEGRLRAELISRNNLASLDTSLGRAGEAHAAFAQVRAACRERGFPDIEAHAAFGVGATAMALGRLAEADAAFAEVEGAAASIGRSVLFARAAARWGVLLAWAGRPDAAEAVRARAEASVRGAGASREAMLLAEVAAATHDAAGRAEEAADAYAALARDAERAGLRLDFARLTLRTGVARAEAGDEAAAARLLDDAARTADESGADEVAALARAHRAALGGADAVVGVVTLRARRDVVAVASRMRAAAALARATGDPSLWRDARADLDRLIVGAPPSWRDGLVEAVPLHRAVLVAT